MVVDPPPSVVIEEKEIKVDRGGDVLRTAVHSWKTEIAYTEKTKNHRVINTFQSKSRFRQQRRARALPSIRPSPRPAPRCRIEPSRTHADAAQGTRDFSSPCLFSPLFSLHGVGTGCAKGWNGHREMEMAGGARTYESVAAEPGPGPARGQ
jgi:hypothetical protein